MTKSSRHWMGLILPWQHNSCPERGIYYSARVPYVRDRLPWLKSERLVTAAVFRSDHTLEFYDTEAADDVKSMQPFCKLDSSSLSLHGLQEFILSWKNIEALYNGMTGVDLAEQHRDTFTANDFLARWLPKKVAGWWTVQRGGRGVAITRNFCCMSDRAIHAVSISACGLSIYKHDLHRSSLLADRDRVVCLSIGHADIDWLLNHFNTDDVVEIRLAMRFYRITIFELAVAHELLPF